MSNGSNSITGPKNPIDVAIVDAGGTQITSFGGGSGGTSHTDQSAFSIGSAASTTPTAFLGNEVSPGGANAITEGQSGIARMTLDRKVLVRAVGAADANRLDISSAGEALTKTVAVTSATLANVASSASTLTLQASNASRRGWACFNDSTQVLYVKFGATASATSYTVKMAAGAYYEMPTTPLYTGIIDGIWASANGSARVTEL